MQRYIFTRAIVLLQLLCLFLASGSGQAGELEREYLKYSDSLFKMVNRVNMTWNMRIQYKPDIEHFGVKAKWTYPVDGYGDCDEYAIAKKRTLCRLGIISFYALCQNSAGKNHLVLFVFTSKGALVLDNATNELKFAHQCSYDWLVVQFPGDVWRDYKTGKAVYPPEGYTAFLKENR